MSMFNRLAPGAAPAAPAAPPPPAPVPSAPAPVPHTPAPSTGAQAANSRFGGRPAVPPAGGARRGGASPWAGMENEQMMNRVNYAKAGDYLARIDEVKEGYKRDGALFVSINMTILKVYDDAGGTGHRVGEKCSHYMGGDYMRKELKTAIVRITQCQPHEVTEENVLRITGDEQLLAGCVIHFTCNWKPVANGTKTIGVVFHDENGMVDPATVQRELGDQFAHFFPQGHVVYMGAA